MVLVYMVAPVTLQVERKRRMLLQRHIGLRVRGYDFLAAITPKAFQRVAKRLFAVHLEHMFLERFKIVKLSRTVVPLAFVGLVLSDPVRDAGRL